MEGVKLRFWYCSIIIPRLSVITSFIYNFSLGTWETVLETLGFGEVSTVQFNLLDVSSELLNVLPT